jgi:AcrR family transcriptional regulator
MSQCDIASQLPCREHPLSHCDVVGYCRCVPRWEPNAKQRLEAAALDLFSSQGYEDTTVAEIARHAGVTSRTYFRHFPDKREALFGNAEAIRNRLAASLKSAPVGLGPLAACLHAMRACEDLFRRRDHDYLTRRTSVIDSAEELQEREARKFRALAADTAAGLHGRGTSELESNLAADVAISIFVHASRLWMDESTLTFSSAVDRAANAAEDLVVAAW